MAASSTPTLIYCGGGNRRFAEIAISAGFCYGAQLPDTVYSDVASLYFADQNWRKPHRPRYMAGLAQYRPVQATVLDLERAEQLPEVLDWAEEAAQYVQRVVIIPKAFGIIERLPRHIGAADVVLGYSVPTRYAGTEVPIWEFTGWPVHLLGGSPHAQMRLWRYLDVSSVDGNYAQLMAVRYCEFWNAGRWHELNAHQEHLEHDAIYAAFSRSCENIITAWREL